MSKNNGKEIVKHEGGDVSALVGKPADMNELFADGFQQVHTVSLKEEGQSIQGLFLGAGPDQESVDESTGEVKYRKTWLIQAMRKDAQGKVETAPATAQLLGAYDIDKFLASLTPGNTAISITRGEQVQHGKRRVNTYAKLYRVIPEFKATGPAMAEIENKTRREAKASAEAAQATA